VLFIEKIVQPIIRNVARSREKHYKVAIEEYKNLFEGTGIPIDIIAGLLGAFHDVLVGFVCRVLFIEKIVQPIIRNVSVLIQRRMARSREKHYKVAIEEYKNLFEGTGIPIDIIAGLPH